MKTKLAMVEREEGASRQREQERSFRCCWLLVCELFGVRKMRVQTKMRYAAVSFFENDRKMTLDIYSLALLQQI